MIIHLDRDSLILNAICIYPVINIVYSIATSGQNMNTFAIVYVSLLILLGLSKYRNVQWRFVWSIFAITFISSLSLLRESTEGLKFLVLFLITVLLYEAYSEKYFKMQIVKEYLYKKQKLFFGVESIYLLLLLYYSLVHGLRFGWSTWVLQGPYNLPHTLSYILFLIMLVNLFFIIEKKSKVAAIFALIEFGCILLTAVRTTLVASIICCIFCLRRITTKQHFSRVMIVCGIILLSFIIASKLSLFDALFEKTVRAIDNGSISNGRDQIFKNSLRNLQIRDGSVITGVGMSRLLEMNEKKLHIRIHAHNDFIDALVCYGIIGACVYIASFVSFSRKNFLWFFASLGFLAFANGLYMYADCLPLLIFGRVLFETDINYNQ